MKSNHRHNIRSDTTVQYLDRRCEWQNTVMDTPVTSENTNKKNRIGTMPETSPIIIFVISYLDGFCNLVNGCGVLVRVRVRVTVSISIPIPISISFFGVFVFVVDILLSVATAATAAAAAAAVGFDGFLAEAVATAVLAILLLFLFALVLYVVAAILVCLLSLYTASRVASWKYGTAVNIYCRYFRYCNARQELKLRLF